MEGQGDMKTYCKLHILLTRATKRLQKMFLERWEILTGSGWENSASNGQLLITGSGRKAYEDAGAFQKISLEDGDVRQWDLSTLSKVLRELDLRNRKDLRAKVKHENNKILKLVEVRNKMVHHSSKSLTAEEFQGFWSTVEEILISFDDSEEELTEMKLAESLCGIGFNASQPRNEENVAEALLAITQADELITKNKVDTALELYSKILALPGLSDKELSLLYLQRSKAYLVTSNDSPEVSKESAQLAVNDAKRARNLQQNWQSYLQLGKSYTALHQLEKALEEFEQAVGVDPTNEEVRKARDECRSELSRFNRQEHLNPVHIPKTLEERVKMLNETVGVNFTAEKLAELENNLENEDSPYADLYRGHRFRYGMGVDQSDVEAVKYYKAAAEAKNAEALYNLAIMTKDGRGVVEKDLKLAVEYLKQAAAQPAVIGLGNNPGVAEAENQLGLLYSDGICVEKDTAIAAHWFQRSVEHGCPTGASNFAFCCLNGFGVKKNMQKAEQYYRFAGDRGLPSAMHCLAHMYLREVDTEQARMWHKRAVQNGEISAQHEEEEFLVAVKRLEESNEKSEVTAWERRNGLPSKFMSMPQRTQRMLQATDPLRAQYVQQLNDVVSNNTDQPRMASPGVRRCVDSLPEIEEFAQRDSVTAKNVVRAIKHFEDASKLILRIVLAGCTDPEMDSQIIHELAECFRIEQVVAYWYQIIKEGAIDTVDRILRHCDKRTCSELDKEARICYAVLHAESLTPTIKFLGECIRKYPKEIFFHQTRCSLLAIRQDFETGLREANNALHLFPKDADLLLAKSSFTRLLKTFRPSEKISACLKYIDAAEPDSRSVPQTYYAVAHQYYLMAEPPQIKGMRRARKVPESQKKEYIEQAKAYMKLGYDSEKIQMPCFLPYECEQRDYTESLLGLVDVEEKSKLNGTADISAAGAVEPSAPNLEVAPVPSLFNSDPEFEKIRLQDPNREELVKTHREVISFLAEENFRKTISIQPRLTQQAPTSLANLKSIYLREMDPTKDKLYEGYVINLTIIEDPVIQDSSIYLVVDDEFRDVRRATLTKDVADNLQNGLAYGSKFSVFNPYMRMPFDQKTPAIRIDDPGSVFFHAADEKLVKRCRYCGKGDSKHSCARCKKANYCSKECQRDDWKRLKHKLICVKGE